jgi:hypothetical protein
VSDLCKCGATKSICPYKTGCLFYDKKSQKKKRLKRKRASPVTKRLKYLAVEVEFTKDIVSDVSQEGPEDH